MLAFFHYIHVAAGATIIGAEIITGWVIYPAYLKLSAEQRREQFPELVRRIGPIMAGALILILIGGIGQVWVSGVVTDWGDLTYGYGLLVSLAVLTVAGWVIVDGLLRGQVDKAIEALDTEGYESGFKRLRMVSGTALVIIIGLMGAMRLGLY